LTEEDSALSTDDQVVLTETFPDLINASSKTPLAISRFQKMITKSSPAFGKALLDILKNLVTEEVKRHLGM